MDFLEEFIVNKFNKGLAVGIITGILLNKITSYFYDFTGSRVASTEKTTESTSHSKIGAGEYKMALLVRHDLKMGKGKVAAQVSLNESLLPFKANFQFYHLLKEIVKIFQSDWIIIIYWKFSWVLKIFFIKLNDRDQSKNILVIQCSHAMVHCYEMGLKKMSLEIKNWELNDKCVDVFKVEDEETMLKYQMLAAENGFNTFIVVDAGRTQVAPHSKTVLAIGPAKCSELNDITNDLEIY